MAKAIAVASKAGNDSTEYALRADGVLFVREGYWNDYYRCWTRTPWSVAHSQDGLTKEIIAHMLFGEMSVAVGFAVGGRHGIYRDKLRLRLPDGE